jgi:hypothetical protein
MTHLGGGVQVGAQTGYFRKPPSAWSSIDVIPVQWIPVAKSSTALCASQSVAAGAAALLNGTAAPSGVITTTDANTFRVTSPPRNVVAAWTTTAVLTVTGYDEYGHLMVEQSASGTSMTGKKAFARVTSISPSASVTGLTAGTGDVLGLPHYLKDKGALFGVGFNDTLAKDAATIVDGDATSPATATTGDVRGTIVPSAAPDAAKVLSLLMFFDRSSTAGEFGVAQYNAGGVE